MQKAIWQMDFATPAFLGDAEQRAQWRTPPIKALLRQWWRVLEWNSRSHNIDSLRKIEGDLFGVAANDGGESRQSQVRLRLDGAWEQGRLAQWPAGEGRVKHREVGQSGQDVGAELYLGYGPLNYERGAGTSLNTVRGSGTKRSAIEPGAQPANMKIAAPDGFPLDELTQLIAWFGTLGSRSRNGWGSLGIEGVTQPGKEDALLARIARPLEDCMKQDWPHALGSDGKGLLIWITAPRANWREVMKELAGVKIAFRTQPRLSLEGVRDGAFGDRHVLAYPVTHHTVSAWGRDGRLANQLRYKVLKQGSQFIGMAFHLPCALPLPQGPTAARQIDVWHAVHAVLDNKMTRLGGAR